MKTCYGVADEHITNPSSVIILPHWILSCKNSPKKNFQNVSLCGAYIYNKEI